MTSPRSLSKVEWRLDTHPAPRSNHSGLPALSLGNENLMTSACLLLSFPFGQFPPQQLIPPPTLPGAHLKLWVQPQIPTCWRKQNYFSLRLLSLLCFVHTVKTGRRNQVLGKSNGILQSGPPGTMGESIAENKGGAEKCNKETTFRAVPCPENFGLKTTWVSFSELLCL